MPDRRAEDRQRMEKEKEQKNKTKRTKKKLAVEISRHSYFQMLRFQTKPSAINSVQMYIMRLTVDILSPRKTTLQI